MSGEDGDEPGGRARAHGVGDELREGGDQGDDEGGHDDVQPAGQRQGRAEPTQEDGGREAETGPGLRPPATGVGLVTAVEVGERAEGGGGGEQRLAERQGEGERDAEGRGRHGGRPPRVRTGGDPSPTARRGGEVVEDHDKDVSRCFTREAHVARLHR
jgi:hypothetical protein